MIFKRVAANLRAQNWGGVALEFVLVVLGVFLAIVAANWNQDRLDRAETRQLLVQLKGQMRQYDGFISGMDRYYAVTARYAAVADAGWRGDPKVSDRDFVIAAYQASQITSIGNNQGVFAQMFGVEDVRNLQNLALRQNLTQLMLFDYALVDLRAVSTRYREEVRKLIPDPVQAEVRSQCGDRFQEGSGITLPPTCSITIPPDVAARTAAELRASPTLARELRWHQAAVANQMQNALGLQTLVRALLAELDKDG